MNGFRCLTWKIRCYFGSSWVFKGCLKFSASLHKLSPASVPHLTFFLLLLLFSRQRWRWARTIRSPPSPGGPGTAWSPDAFLSEGAADPLPRLQECKWRGHGAASTPYIMYTSGGFVLSWMSLSLGHQKTCFSLICFCFILYFWLFLAGAVCTAPLFLFFTPHSRHSKLVIKHLRCAISPIDPHLLAPSAIVSNCAYYVKNWDVIWE